MTNEDVDLYALAQAKVEEAAKAKKHTEKVKQDSIAERQRMQEDRERRYEAEQEAKKPVFVLGTEVEYEPPRWLIPGYIQRGAITLVAAHPGTGKTAFACGLAACVSTGSPLYDVPVETPGKVLMLSGEDDMSVLVGRFIASGGKRENIIFASNIATAGLTMKSPEIEEIIKAQDVKLVVFDPYQLFLGAEVDMNKANQTRPVLAHLAEMCKRTDCAAIIVAHQSKHGGDVVASLRALGSVDLPAACRSVLNIIRDPEDRDNGCIVVQTKNNSAPIADSLTYQFIDRGGIVFTGCTDVTIEEIEAAAKKKKARKLDYEKEPLVQVINKLIGDNPNGIRLTYFKFDTACQEILGLIPYRQESRDELKKRLEAIKDDLLQRDGIMMEIGVVMAKNKRGIALVRHHLPKFYQSSLPELLG